MTLYSIQTGDHHIGWLQVRFFMAQTIQMDFKKAAFAWLDWMALQLKNQRYNNLCNQFLQDSNQN